MLCVPAWAPVVGRSGTTRCMCVRGRVTRAVCMCRAQAAQQGQCLMGRAVPQVLHGPHPVGRPIARRHRTKKASVPRALAACAARPVMRLVAATAALRQTNSRRFNLRRAFSLSAVSAYRRHRIHARTPTAAPASGQRMPLQCFAATMCASAAGSFSASGEASPHARKTRQRTASKLRRYWSTGPTSAGIPELST